MQTVLVIDDSDDVRGVIVKTLAHFGFSTCEAKDGASGIQTAVRDQPDLIICDIRMPGMDGFHTLSAIREHPAIATIPFIFLSAAIDKSDMRRGMASGADDYLTKPFTPHELIEAVTARLAKQAELKCEIYKQAVKLRADVVHLLSQEITGPIDSILDLTTTMMREHSFLSPEKVFVSARQINDSLIRLNQLARSLA
ncbi:response regulator [Pedosphaera parvula]|uniref:Response regulator receiver protein n=1 Tax=Pedosphaera parvula (strain Ellin514) TaxID=320771 RepID=B9XSD3_PEDPL|nr:response regulator [Pedosphaera parvula]EEF57266.1 response regulator receiver protein [Pedosphaera parvula Ellin514]